ncbi:hypothetical protein L7F22_045524 [Adiantum nelumboides]|nr:hypothetical protein [Adiantum nelumboides]
MFTTLGMVESSRYRVCQGSQDNMHSPILYPPSLEDNYSGNVVRCECNAIQKATRKLKRDCKECCEKCTVCGISRKQMMCFDYISIEHQLKCLTRSQSICHEFLEMWRNKKRWLDNSCISEDTKIHEFWDGTKCKNFEDFWNPNSHFELPVICPNSEYKQAYRAWPTPDNALQAGSTKYKILCKSCREEFECDKVLCKGDPRNFALLVHWDGFQSSKTTQKNCGVVEVKILNTGKGSEVRALPVIFIPFSCFYFPMPIIDEEEEQKKDHMETDKFLMDIKGFEGLQQYKDEDDDNLDHDLEISYTELLQNGLSKRVQATKELSPRDETPMLESYEPCRQQRQISFASGLHDALPLCQQSSETVVCASIEVRQLEHQTNSCETQLVVQGLCPSVDFGVAQQESSDSKMMNCVDDRHDDALRSFTDIPLLMSDSLSHGTSCVDVIARETDACEPCMAMLIDTEFLYNISSCIVEVSELISPSVDCFKGTLNNAEQPLRLIEDIKFAAEEVDVYQQECRELCSRVDTLASCMGTAIRMVRQDNPRFCEHPTRRIVDETSHSLELSCFLIKKCRKGSLLRRIVTITTAAEFKKAKSCLEDAIANVNWLLSSVTDEETVSVIGLPPITGTFPNLSVVWSLLSKLQGGTQKLREAAAIDLALMASASEQNGQFIINEGGVSLLMKALHDGTLQCKIMAATALRNLAVNREHVHKMVQEGVIPACVRVLEQGARQVQVKVAWVLAEMIVQDQETQIILGSTKVIMYLVALLLETMNDNIRSSVVVPSGVLVNVGSSCLQEVTSSEHVGSSHASSSDNVTGEGCGTGEELHYSLNANETPYDTNQSSNGPLKGKEEIGDFKVDLQVQVTRALWLLSTNNLDNCRKIAETRAMLGLAKLIEVAHGEVQKNAAMTIMELAAVAEGNADFRKFAFKLTSPAARTTIKQLHQIILDNSADPYVKICCIRAVGSLARAFSAKGNDLIKALVLRLSETDKQHLPIVVEALNALLKFTDKDNFLCQEHSVAILEVPGLPFLVQLVALATEKGVQFPAIHLLSQLALHVGRSKGEAFQEAAALSVLKSVASSASTVRQYAEFSSEDDIFQAIYHLEFCRADKTYVHSSYQTQTQ